MRHRKKTVKLGRNSSHRRSLFANMLKSLVTHGRVETTVEKAKALRSYADKLITLAKKDDLASRREAKARLMLRYNSLDSKQAREARKGNKEAYNDDRFVLDRLFGDLGKRFSERNGGYTRVVRTGRRRGDNAPLAVIEYLEG